MLRPGRAAAEIEVMRDRRAEAHDAAADEDRREDEHVRDVLAALERVVVDQEVALFQRLAGWRLRQARSVSPIGPSCIGISSA
jgi:hypothetical protein